MKGELLFAPLTTEALIGAAINAAAFGGTDGYVLACCDLSRAIAQRLTGDPRAIWFHAYASHIDVGSQS